MRRLISFEQSTVDGYFGWVAKARVLKAVRQGASERDADSLAGLKKADVAGHAERCSPASGSCRPCSARRRQS